MLEVGHYYSLVHKRSHKYDKKKCIVKVVKQFSSDIYGMKVLRCEPKFESGKNRDVSVRWYEDWCSSIRELKYCEVLALEL